MCNLHKRINVLHLIDSLDLGGAERVAVNLVNSLPRERYRPFLCTTRRKGALISFINDDVNVFFLNRRKRVDFRALKELADFIKSNQIDIIHAHSTSLFTARIISLLRVRTPIIWHDHYGNHDNKERSKFIYGLAIRGLKGIIAVNQQLVTWLKVKLLFPQEKIWYVPNFSLVNEKSIVSNKLPGKKGSRIVCVANLRPQKDHITLIRSMAEVVLVDPNAHLLLVGNTNDTTTVNNVKNEIKKLDLTRNVSILGVQTEVYSVLRDCDVGVLSSVSEGLPLALLEYGLAKLPVVVTDVGQCSDVLQNGLLGLIVPRSNPTEIAKAILLFLQNKELSRTYSEAFHKHVRDLFDPEKIMLKICSIYETILSK